MPKQRYKCENSADLCPYALENKLVELEPGERPSCGVSGCTREKLIAVGGSAAGLGKAKKGPPVAVILAVVGGLLCAVAGGAWFLLQPDEKKANLLLEEFYPALPSKGATGK